MKSQLGKILIPSLLMTLIGCSGESEIVPPPDDGKIAEAGELRLLPEFDEGDPLKPASTEADIPISDGVTAMCTTEGWGASKVRELTNVVGLDLNGTTIYPGALLQGADFEDGQFVPITIPRAPGTIYMTGLVLDQGAQYLANDISMTGANVNQAIKELITDYGVQGTEANASFQEQTTHSYENMLFELGIDARFGAVNMEADLSIETSNTRNYTFAKFTQVFYDIVYEDPELATSVFKDGASFTDPEGQIGPGNPPLYVSKVSYGRMVFFVAESTHDSKEVGVALEAAVKGGAGSGKVSSGLTYEEVMARSKVYYYVVGGAADLALAPINSASQSEMFTAVKNFIANRESANFSAGNPGAPIAYSLKYLKDRTSARMSYNVNYDKKDCEFFHSAPEPTVTNLTLDVSGITGKADLYVNGVKKGRTVRSPDRWDLNQYMKAGNNDFELVFNRDAFGCINHSITWELQNNGSRIARRTITQNATLICPWTNYRMHWTLNKETGAYSNYREFGT